MNAPLEESAARIATAMERIAQALEDGKAGPAPPPQPEPPQQVEPPR